MYVKHPTLGTGKAIAFRDRHGIVVDKYEADQVYILFDNDDAMESKANWYSADEVVVISYGSRF